jgi:hypothetical protein
MPKRKKEEEESIPVWVRFSVVLREKDWNDESLDTNSDTESESSISVVSSYVKFPSETDVEYCEVDLWDDGHLDTL